MLSAMWTLIWVLGLTFIQSRSLLWHLGKAAENDSNVLGTWTHVQDLLKLPACRHSACDGADEDLCSFSHCNSAFQTKKVNHKTKQNNTTQHSTQQNKTLLSCGSLWIFPHYYWHKKWMDIGTWCLDAGYFTSGLVVLLQWLLLYPISTKKKKKNWNVTKIISM